MPFGKIRLNPGFNSQATQALNEGGFYKGSLVRFRSGLIQKIAGWEQLFPNACAGIVRAMHAYEDLYSNNTLLLGSDGGAQIYASGTLNNANFVGATLSNMTYSTTSGSITVTVTGAPTNVTFSTGSKIQFAQITSIGGYFFIPGSTVSIVTAGSGTFTFNLPGNATATYSGPGITTYEFYYGSSQTQNVIVTFPGYANAPTDNKTYYFPKYSEDMFIIPVNTTYYNTNPPGAIFGGIDVSMSGTVSANNGILVVDANTFVMPPTPYFGPKNSYIGPAFTIQSGENYNGSTTLQLYGTQASFDPNTPGTGLVWTVDNFGNYGLFCQAGGPIYLYTPPPNSTISLANISTGPQVNAGMFVAMPQAQIIAFGSESVLGSGTQDPLLVRWCDAGDQTDWVASTTNQAGSFHLSRGSKCVGGTQAPQTTLIWTDIDLWSMAYVGQPLIYDFTIIGSGCGLISLQARCSQGRNTYWMGQKSFWVFGDYGVQQIECPLWDYVFPDLDLSNSEKCFAASNSSAGEIMFFFPSKSGGIGECDSYVKYNVLEQLWDPGRLQRSAWVDETVFGAPLGADLTFLIQQHETGYDANGVPMTGAYFETGFFDIGDGDKIMYLDLMIPDFKWLGTGGFVSITVWGSASPGEDPVMYGPFPVTSKTPEFSTGGIRHRQLALRVDWGSDLGFGATLGAIRIRTSPAGRAN